MTSAAIRPWAITDRCAAATEEPCELVRMGVFPDETGLVGQMSVERCRNCGVGVTRPPIADVGFLYQDRESDDFQTTTAGLSRAIKRFVFKRQAREMLRQVGQATTRVIDFGCGSGLFTSCLAEALPAGATLVGTDFHLIGPPDLEAVAYKPMSDLDDLDSSADLLIAMHVLEHDDDSMKLLRRMIAPVRSGGRLLIEVPNIDCAWATVFGRHWASWYLPYHRVHFSRASLRTLIERSGLRIVGAYDVTVPSMGRTIANILGKQNNTIFILLSAVLNPLQVLLERLTGRPSALRIIAQK